MQEGGAASHLRTCSATPAPALWTYKYVLKGSVHQHMMHASTGVHHIGVFDREDGAQAFLYTSTETLHQYNAHVGGAGGRSHRRRE